MNVLVEQNNRHNSLREHWALQLFNAVHDSLLTMLYLILILSDLSSTAVLVLQGRGALQDIDQMSLFKPLCKFCASIRTIREIVPTVRKALAIAQSGTPGPVFIEFPIDTLYPYHLVSKEFGVKNPPKGLMGKIVSWYVIGMSFSHGTCYYLVCVKYQNEIE